MSLAEPMSPYQSEYAIGFNSPPDQSPTYDSMMNDDENTGMSSLHYTFTPTRLKPQPRAWERKASTPYASRHDAQKIWKRVPLQGVSANVNATWRKGETKDDGVMRPVKKLRTTTVAGLDNEETQGFVTSKWEKRDEIEGTPRRRQPQSSFEIYSSDNGTNGSPAQTEAQLDISASETTTTDIQEAATARVDDDIDGVFIDEDLEMLPLGRFSPAHQYVDPQLLELDQRGSNFAEGDDIVPPSMAQRDRPKVLSRAANLTRVLQLGSANQTLVGSRSCTPGTVDNTYEKATRNMVEQSADDKVSDQSAQADHDDTSYLQKFLLRAQAQRVAKSQSNEAPREPPNDQSIEPASEDRLFDQADEDEPYKPESSSQESNEDEAESQASSDCRRSARAITRLPRLQKPSTTVPSNISLRRLNGSEFISMQKDIQNLALTTRANTKKNKCTAVSVRQRLMQLQAEVWQDVEDEKPVKKTRKAVAWAETIARFQDEDGKELAVEAALLETTNTAQTIPEETAASTEQPQLLQSEPSEPETTIESKKRVRRQRKANSGTENGTPAPKRTMEMMIAAASQPQTKVTDKKVEKIEKIAKIPMKQIPRKTRTSTRVKPRDG